MKYLITGSAGFIGFHLCQLLLKDKNNKIIGIDNHPMLNKKFKRLKDDKVFIMDGVNIHWWMGYYYIATLRDENNSHAVRFIENINCQDESVLEDIENFTKDYILI